MNTKSSVLLFVALAAAGCSAGREEKVSASYQADYDKVVSVHDKTVDGAIYSSAQPGFFVADRRAHAVGDVITITLAETTQASKSTDGTISRKGTTAATLPPIISGPLSILGLTNSGVTSSGALDSSATQSYAGKGVADQSNSLTGTLTAMVTRVYENGNMWVEGQKSLTLNQGEEYIRVSGLVRPEDIAAGNLVSSGRIAQAQISYTGSGDLADAAKQNWYGKLFGWASPL
jgi:flagellar L-ring protein precursor FlgH